MITRRAYLDIVAGAHDSDRASWSFLPQNRHDWSRALRSPTRFAVAVSRYARQKGGRVLSTDALNSPSLLFSRSIISPFHHSTTPFPR